MFLQQYQKNNIHVYNSLKSENLISRGGVKVCYTRHFFHIFAISFFLRNLCFFWRDRSVSTFKVRIFSINHY